MLSLISMPAKLLVRRICAGIDGVVLPMSAVKWESGVKALGFITVPVQVRLDGVVMHAAKASPLPITRLNAKPQMT